MKCGMSCSLFEVVDGKGKPTCGSLAALVSKLERDRMVSHPVVVTHQVLIHYISRKICTECTNSQFNSFSLFPSCFLKCEKACREVKNKSKVCYTVLHLCFIMCFTKHFPLYQENSFVKIIHIL